MLLFSNLVKGREPVLSTSSIINIQGTSATSGGIIISEGSGTVFQEAFAT